MSFHLFWLKTLGVVVDEVLGMVMVVKLDVVIHC